MHRKAIRQILLSLPWIMCLRILLLSNLLIAAQMRSKHRLLGSYKSWYRLFKGHPGACPAASAFARCHLAEHCIITGDACFCALDPILLQKGEGHHEQYEQSLRHDFNPSWIPTCFPAAHSHALLQRFANKLQEGGSVPTSMQSEQS